MGAELSGTALLPPHEDVAELGCVLRVDFIIPSRLEMLGRPRQCLAQSSQEGDVFKA